MSRLELLEDLLNEKGIELIDVCIEADETTVDCIIEELEEEYPELEDELRDKVVEQLYSELKDLELEVDIDLVDLEYITSADMLKDELENVGAFNAEIIYFANAMEYLMEEDISLQESLQLASDMGYDCSNLNSEMLASLLKSERMREEFDDHFSEIENIFEELNI